MKAAEALPTPAGGAEVWPLSVEAYHVLGEARLIPERTELLYGFVYHKMSKSPLHSFSRAVVAGPTPSRRAERLCGAYRSSLSRAWIPNRNPILLWCVVRLAISG